MLLLNVIGFHDVQYKARERHRELELLKSKYRLAEQETVSDQLMHVCHLLCCHLLTT